MPSGPPRRRGRCSSLPFVATSPDALADAALEDELAHQLDRGGATLADLLGVAPTQATWLAGPDLGGRGLSLLTSLGVRRAIVTPHPGGAGHRRRADTGPALRAGAPPGRPRAGGAGR